MTLSGPVLAPRAGGLPTNLVVLLHGYGADGEDLIGLGQHWAEAFPQTLFAAPNAPNSCAGNPFGYEWFALDFDDMTGSVAAGVPGAAPLVGEYLAELWTRTGLGPADTILVGFSQGAMLALYAGLSMDPPPRGIVAFSGALLPPPGLSGGTAPKVPVCLIHGERDQVVDPRLSVDAAQALRALGYDVQMHVSRGLAHGISPDGLDVATGFMRRLGPPASG